MGISLFLLSRIWVLVFVEVVYRRSVDSIGNLEGFCFLCRSFTCKDSDCCLLGLTLRTTALPAETCNIKTANKCGNLCNHCQSSSTYLKFLRPTCTTRAEMGRSTGNRIFQMRVHEFILFSIRDMQYREATFVHIALYSGFEQCEVCVSM